MDASGRISDRRHPEWTRHQLRWRWLVDSYEGGDAYRLAIYGTDTRGLPIRNLVRHKREYPQAQDGDALSPYVDPSTYATDDDYNLRLSRTPVPTWVREVCDDHLARVYAREVEREGPDGIKEWWEDVDGRGTPIDRWMQETAAPLLYTLGQIDFLVDHPPAPEGAAVESQADVLSLGLDVAVVRVVLPDDIVWWRLDGRTGQYLEVLIREVYYDSEARRVPAWRYRHWTATSSTLYDDRGKRLEEMPHPFGRVPMARVYDRRRPRCEHVGLSRLEGVADRQREFYNRDSELILSDTTQAHPLLQGPEDYIAADGTIPIGPSWLLPKKKSQTGSTPVYEGFEVIDFPKGGAESIRTNKMDLRDQVDREACLAKPAGSSSGGTSAGVVAQSGLSKSFDHQALANRLVSLAAVLQEAEYQLVRLVRLVLSDGAEDSLDDVTINYPAQFDVLGPQDLADGIDQLQTAVDRSGSLPEVETDLLGQLVRALMPGRSDEEYQEFDEQIREAVAARASAMTGHAATMDMTTNGGRINQPDPAAGGQPVAGDELDGTGDELDTGDV